jgi:hypothetical protein
MDTSIEETLQTVHFPWKNVLYSLTWKIIILVTQDADSSCHCPNDSSYATNLSTMITKFQAFHAVNLFLCITHYWAGISGIIRFSIHLAVAAGTSANLLFMFQYYTTNVATPLITKRIPGWQTWKKAMLGRVAMNNFCLEIEFRYQ